jgi:uncharacterized protein (TIGR02271 family)
MANLIPTSDLVRDRNYDMGNDSYDFIGKKAYGNNGEHVGTVREALTEEGGKIRYFVVEVGNWFTSKEVVVPVGLARVEDDGVYFDSLTKDQVKDMNEYTLGQDYGDDAQMADIRTLRGTDYVAPATGTRTLKAADHYEDQKLFGTPTRLQLLEERLMVNKEKYQAGSVQVGKKVETRTENVNVALSHDEVVIERHPVTESRPVEGNVVLGAATDTIRVDLEAERANVSKQAYVTEEVEVGKRTETEQKTYSDTVGREVLDVTKTGEVELTGDLKTDARNTDARNTDKI